MNRCDAPIVVGPLPPFAWVFIGIMAGALLAIACALAEISKTLERKLAPPAPATSGADAR